MDRIDRMKVEVDKDNAEKDRVLAAKALALFGKIRSIRVTHEDMLRDGGTIEVSFSDQDGHPWSLEQHWNSTVLQVSTYLDEEPSRFSVPFASDEERRILGLLGTSMKMPGLHASMEAKCAWRNAIVEQARDGTDPVRTVELVALMHRRGLRDSADRLDPKSLADALANCSVSHDGPGYASVKFVDPAGRTEEILVVRRSDGALLSNRRISRKDGHSDTAYGNMHFFDLYADYQNGREIIYE